MAEPKTINADELAGTLDTLKAQRNKAHDEIAALTGQLWQAAAVIKEKDKTIEQLQAEDQEQEK